MPAVLADYRTELDNLLAVAVDSSTWTTAIKDEAIRRALEEYNDALVYETSFTVTSSDYQQDLSTLSALGQILVIAYPWTADAPFAGRIIPFRTVDYQIVCLEIRQKPAVNDVLRVRYTKKHTIQNLDAAAATTIPDNHKRVLNLGAAGWACDLRIRQISENPAIPKDAANQLRQLREEYMDRFQRALGTTQQRIIPAWNSLGL
jgi:hypothetical protein